MSVYRERPLWPLAMPRWVHPHRGDSIPFPTSGRLHVNPSPATTLCASCKGSQPVFSLSLSLSPFLRRCGAERGQVMSTLASQNMFINQFQKVDVPTKSSTQCFLLLLQVLSRRFWGGVDFLKLIDKYIVSDKTAVQEYTDEASEEGELQDCSLMKCIDQLILRKSTSP